jgi:predicted nucleic acid-binding protein
MNVLVDTSVWSLALRRRRTSIDPAASELAELVREGRAVVIGPIRQELLSGVPSDQQFKELRVHMQAFPDLSLQTTDYEEAAQFYNECRAKGVQGSNTDFLICAAAARRGLSVLTTDVDFHHFARLLPVKLHPIRPYTGK